MFGKSILLTLALMLFCQAMAAAGVCTTEVRGNLRPLPTADRQKGKDPADSIYRDSIQLFARGCVDDARFQMRRFLRQDPYYNGIALEFTDEDIDDIIESQIEHAEVLSTGCFIQHYIYMATPPGGWTKDRLDRYLKERYHAGLNGLITFDEGTLRNEKIRDKLHEDVNEWGCAEPRELGGGLPIITSRILRQIAGRTLLNTQEGPVNVCMVGKVGNDREGLKIRRELEDEWRMDIKGLDAVAGSPTAISIVLSFGDYGRTFIKLQPENANFKFSQREIPDEAIGGADVIHIGGPTLTPKFLEEMPGFLVRAKHVPRDSRFKGEVKIVVDTTTDQHLDWNRVFELHPEAYGYIDALSVSFDEAARITGMDSIDDMLDFFIKKGVKTVFLKRGEVGSYVAYVDEQEARTVSFHVPALKGLKTGAPLWDETGAGDAYTAGLIYGIIHGWDIRKTTLFATVLGGMSCRYAGGTIGNEGIVHAVYNMRRLRRQIADEAGHQAKVDLVSSQGI
jgi:sugar/nucleoside kinase (ribokinase family)